MNDYSNNQFVPGPPAGFIERDEIQRIIQFIEAQKKPPYPIIYIHGIGGIGKTTIAEAICKYFRETDDLRFCEEGAIWITLKDIGDEELIKVIRDKSQIVLKGVTVPENATLETTTQFFNNHVIGKKNMILVFDDLWKPFHFDVLYSEDNSNVLRICTAHSEEYLSDYPLIEKFPIEKMSPKDSFALLSRKLTVPKIYRERMEKLAERAVYYPTVLALINVFMRDFSKNESFAYIFEETVKLLDKNGLSAFDKTDSEEGKRNKVVKAAIETNLKHLSPVGLGMYERLTIFTSPENIDSKLAIRFFANKFAMEESEVKREIYAMEKLLLVRQNGPMISFNDVTFEYMRKKLADETTFHLEFLTTMEASKWQNWTGDDLYLWENVIHHYVRGGALDAAFSLIFDLNFVAKKISYLQTHTVENDILLLLKYCEGEQQQEDIHRILKRISNCNHLLNACGKNERQLISALKTRVFYDRGHARLPPHFEAFVPLPDLPSKELVRTFFGHDGRIYGCHIDRQGKTIVTASDDTKVILWNVENGDIQRKLEGHKNRVFCAKISEDGRFVVTGSADYHLRIWDLKSKDPRQSRVLDDHKGSIWACDVSSDLKIIISASEDQTVKVWNFQSGALLDTLREHKAPVTGCRLYNDGEYIVSSGHDNQVIIWEKDAASGKYKPFRKLARHSAAVWSCAVSNTGRIISSAIDCEVRLWNIFDESDEDLLGSHTGPVWGCDISEDGKLGFSVSEDMEVKVWDLDKRKEMTTLLGHSRYIWGVSYCSDKKLLLSCSLDSTAKLWDLSTLEE